MSDFPFAHIHEGKHAKVEEIIRTLINDGRQMLHVVADYDFTLTMYEKNGRGLPSTFGVIERNDHVKVSSIQCLISLMIDSSYPMDHFFVNGLKN